MQTIGNIGVSPAVAMLYKGEAWPAYDGSTPLTTYRWVGPNMADTTVERTVCVYKATCLVTGRAYIGITMRDLNERRDEHIEAARKLLPASLLSRAIKKHGAENFTFVVLIGGLTKDEAYDAEREMIATHGTLAPAGYNKTTGGEAFPGWNHVDEVKAQLSKKGRALWSDPDYRERMLLSFQGRVLPESHIEHLRALAAAKKGKPRSAAATEKSRAALMGHAVSEETRAKISAAGKGKHKWSDERKARQSERIRQLHVEGRYDSASAGRSEKAVKRWADPAFLASFVPPMLGRTHTAEARAKIAAARRGRKKIPSPTQIEFEL
jgi:group I intron endonuclease